MGWLVECISLCKYPKIDGCDSKYTVSLIPSHSGIWLSAVISHDIEPFIHIHHYMNDIKMDVCRFIHALYTIQENKFSLQYMFFKANKYDKYMPHYRNTLKR